MIHVGKLKIFVTKDIYSGISGRGGHITKVT